MYLEGQTIIIGLPVYNESGSIQELLERISGFMQYRHLDYRILIYNDGSDDDSLKKCQEFHEKDENLIIIDGKVNKGLGTALKELVLYSIHHFNDNDILVVMDSDNTHNPEHIFTMINRIRDGFDVVIASRYTQDSRVVGVSGFRKFLSYGASLMFRTLFPIKGVRDYTCGYRAYNMSRLKKIYETYGDQLITETGFACMAELLVKLRSTNILACEVPIILRYDWKVDDSKMKILRTVLNTLKLALKRF